VARNINLIADLAVSSWSALVHNLFRVVARPDRFATWRDEFGKKRADGLDVTLELDEGKLLIEAIAAAAPGVPDAIGSRTSHKAIDRIALPTEAATAAGLRPGLIVGAEMPVNAERRAAEFAPWYELFPCGDPLRRGTIRDMGFEVVYVPIARGNRQGRDTSLTPAADDPDHPYAIGGPDGGHRAIQRVLGTIDDFRALRDAAAAALVAGDPPHGHGELWIGEYRTISFDPRTLPFGIWRARPREMS
jgi:starch synthase (maltosyl-transferring)